MLDNGFMFGNMATWDFPICKVEKYPDIHAPVRRRDPLSIPGRSGELHVAEDAFENVPKTYACYFHADNFVSETANAVKAWLLSNPGYQRLIDLYEQEHYYRAVVLEEISFSNWMGKYSRFVVNFSCDPRHFLISGDNALTFSTSGSVVRSPTVFPALPIIHIFGEGTGELTIGKTTVSILGFNGDITLDCEDMDAYRVADGLLVNCNGLIYAPEFPVLQPGENSISWSGGIDHIEIIPRWWTL